MFASNALNALARIYPGLALTQRQAGDASFLAKLESGQRLRATVQAHLANGEFMVSLDAADGQVLHMKLPPGIRSGDLLKLVVVSREPRLTFALDADAPPAGVSSQLSQTGRFIDNLLQRSSFPRSSVMLSGGAPFDFPLLSAPPADGAVLAQSLASALGRSGLFYESHQAQWVMGTRSLAALLLEPQASLSSQPVSLSGTDAEPEIIPAIIVHDNIGDAAAVDGTAGPVHPAALALVRQQLEVFETRQFGWQGVAWPGQSIAWEVAEEAPRKQDPEERKGANLTSSAVWKSCLRLTLPNLGQITANLRLETRGIDVQLAAKEPLAASVLRAGAAPLTIGLQSAGITLLDMGVEIDREA